MAIITTQIPIEQLDLGMVVVRFDKSGLNYSNYGSPLKDISLRKYLIDNGVKYAFIRQEVKAEVKQTRTESPAPNKNNYVEMLKTANTEAQVADKLPTIKEIQKVVQAHNKAKQITKELLSDIRLGKIVDTSVAKDVVSEFVGHCIENPEAFVNISRLKDFDQYTFTHSVNVSVLSIAIGRKLEESVPLLQDLGFAGLMHDVGKMMVPERVLNKPDRLTPEEFEIMKSHPEKGYEYMKKMGHMKDEVLSAVRHHHEKFDGSGYPDGQTDASIPTFAKIIAIADVYDAITSDRCYHNGLVPSDALKLIFSWSGKHFNDALVKFFITIMGIYPVGTLVLLDTGELAVIIEPNKNDPIRPQVIIISDRQQQPAPSQMFALETKFSNGTPQKTIVSALDSKEFGVDPNRMIEQYIRG